MRYMSVEDKIRIDLEEQQNMDNIDYELQENGAVFYDED